MRRTLLLMLIASATLCGCATTVPRTQDGVADLVLRNGKIITVDPGFSIAQAIAIRKDRILAVGSDADMSSRIDSTTRVIDLGGRAVIPGLIDSHLHSAGGGPGLDLSNTRSIADLLAAVERAAKLAHEDELIVSNNDWHEAQLKEKRLPHRTELDRVAPNNPVVLIRGGHEYILNSRALAHWNIARDTKSPAGGELGRDPDGNLNGELVDNARGLVQLPPPPKLVPEEIVEQMARLNAVGITGIRIPGAFKLIADPITPYRFLQQLRAQGKLTVRVNYLMRIYDFSSPERMRELVQSWKVSPNEGDEWLRIGGMKTLVDGGFEGGHMREAYAEPYGHHGAYKGIEVVPRARYIPIVRELNRLGWRVATHAVGDAAIDEVLDAYEAADRDQSIKDKMWVIEHAFIARPDHYPRMRALGLAISAQDHLYLAAPSMKAYWGAQRAENVTPMATFLKQKFLVASGTDSPVIPYSPFWALYHFTTRDTIADGVYGAHERISREDALRTYTVNGARLTFEEGIKGSLEPGKLADLVILSGDYLTVPDKEVERMRALATMVGGKFVYMAPDYRP